VELLVLADLSVRCELHFMKQAVVFIFVLISCSYFAYKSGKEEGVRSTTQQWVDDSHEWAQTEFEFLKANSIGMTPIALHTGKYELKTEYPFASPGPWILTLTVSNSTFTSPDWPINGHINGNVIDWEYEGRMPGYKARWVGVVHQDTIYGHVFGWGQGFDSVGIWKLTPVNAINTEQDAPRKD
jgi:hypothetical protein